MTDIKKGDTVQVVRVIPGGFTEGYLNKIGVVIHADSSLVPFLVLFNPEEKDSKKWNTAWFLNGRLAKVNA